MFKKTLVVLMTLVLMLSLVLTGCGQSAPEQSQEQGQQPSEQQGPSEQYAQGVTDDTVVIGSHMALTGPVAPIGVPMSHGLLAYVNYVNDNGGINGRKLEVKIEDDQFNPATALQKVQKLVEQDKVFALVGTLGTPGLLASMDYIAEKGIPSVYQGSGSSAFAIPFKKNYFPVQPNYTMEGKLFAQYAVDDLKATKIAVFYQNDDEGKEGLNGFKQGLDEMGKSDMLVEEIAFNTTDVDFSSHVLKAKNSGTDVAVMLGTAKPAAGILNEAKKISYNPQWLATYVLSDFTMFNLAKDAWDGAIVAGWAYPITDTSNPKVKLFLDNMAKYFPDETPSGYNVAGWIAGEVFAEGLKRAGDDLTWDGYIKAMETLNQWNDGLAYKLTYTPEAHNPQTSMYFMKAVYRGENDFTYENITDFIELK